MRPGDISKAVLVLAMSHVLVGCASGRNDQILETGGKSQVELRAIQGRTFATSDKEKTLRTVIATMQDLGFVMDKAHFELGTVTGTKLDGYQLRMSVAVRPRDPTTMIVRANCNIDHLPVVDPEPYRQFFLALEKAMFLEAHPID